jgi:hypothetical protein
MPTQNFGSAALATSFLMLFLLERLVKKKVFSATEISELADEALLKLEEHQSGFDEENRMDFEEARRLLETLVRDYKDKPR